MIAAVTMVRDEADVIEATLRHLVNEGVDWLLVADNASSDGTSEILERLRSELPLEVVHDAEQGYWQSRKMTRLTRVAGERGAEWVIPFDADEVWYSLSGTLAETLAATDAQAVRAVGFDHIALGGETGHPFKSIQYRKPVRQKFPKVAFRADPSARLAQGNHSVNLPTSPSKIRFRHFQYRSFEHMARKVRAGAAAMALTDMPWSECAHWREAAQLSDEELRARWDELASTPDLVLDPAPVRF